MSKLIQSNLEEKIVGNLEKNFSPDQISLLSQQFRKHGFLKISNVVPVEIREEVKAEVKQLLDNFAERRDLKLPTTEDTPRRMSVVQSEEIAQNSQLIPGLYRCQPLVGFLETLAGERFLSCPSKDEEFLITRHEKAGDTHGWHWGDFSYALIWILQAPPIEYGGLLQCIPHTKWDKHHPRIYEYLCANQIDTYSFVSGDIYLLRTDTTLHRTIPLNCDATRIILNMTWASDRDLSKQLVGNDRWWSVADVETRSSEEIHSN